MYRVVAWRAYVTSLSDLDGSEASEITVRVVARGRVEREVLARERAAMSSASSMRLAACISASPVVSTETNASREVRERVCRTASETELEGVDANAFTETIRSARSSRWVQTAAVRRGR